MKPPPVLDPTFKSCLDFYREDEGRVGSELIINTANLFKKEGEDIGTPPHSQHVGPTRACNVNVSTADVASNEVHIPLIQFLSQQWAE